MQTSISAFLKTFDFSQAKSLSQIQKQALRSTPRKTTTNRILFHTENINDLKVISPFYPKPQPCTNKHCLCPFHRKQRLKLVPLKKKQNRPTHFKTANNSPTKKLKTQPRDAVVRFTHRSPLQRKQSTKYKKTVINLQGRPKVQSHNLDFDQFLQQFQQILLKKSKSTTLDLHKIKSPVGEIFKYIYTHLHVQNEVAREHISKIQKDRDFTDFYMQRFIELKERSFKKKEDKELRLIKQKSTAYQPTPEIQTRNRNISLSRTKSKFQRKQLSKKTMKSRHQRLMAQRMLEDIDCGEEIQQDEIQKFADLQLQIFEQNCEYLAKKVKDMDEDTLQDLLNQVVKKAHQALSLRESSQANSTKIASLENIMGCIKAQIKTIQQGQGQGQQQHKSYRTGNSSISLSRANSHNSIRNNKRSTVLNKSNDMAFAKSGFNQLKKDGKDSEICKEGDENQTIQNQDPAQMVGPIRQSPKALTIFQEGDVQNIAIRTGNSSKLKLAKYRKLSHDAFYHKKILNEEEQELVFSKMKITTLEDIENQLNSLASQFTEKKKKRLRDIQCKIKEFNMRKFMVNENDSLITAKRKLRVLKSLIKHDQLEEQVKEEMKQYLKMMEEQNYVKNRKWANNKIKNVLNLKPEDQQVQIFDGEYEQEDKYYFQQVVTEIFGKGSKLLYYDLFKTTYEEKEINFQHHPNANDSNKVTVIQQKKQRELKTIKKKTFIQKNKTAVYDLEERESALKQVGLNDKCFSNYFLLSDQNSSQQRYQTRNLLQEDQPYLLSEDRYLSLLNKLSKFSK